MKAQAIFKITVKNFLKHNPKSKKQFTHLMLSKSYFSDYKIAQLTPHESLLFIYLLTICADFAHDSILISTQSLPNSLRIRTQSLHNALLRFQQLQLLTFDKIDVLNNRIEENRIEEKRREGQGVRKRTPKNSAPVIGNAIPSESPPKLNLVIARYCELWKARYNADPPISGRIAGQLKTFVKDHGEIKALSFIEAYLQMPDSWFVKKRHDIPTMLSNLNAIAQFLATGKIFSNKEIQALDSAVNAKNLIDMIESGEV